MNHWWANSETCVKSFQQSRSCQHTSDISVSKINLVSVTVLCVTGSFPFLFYFSFENLFRFSCQFSNHSYFSFSLYFRFRVYYFDQKINDTHLKIVTICYTTGTWLLLRSTSTSRHLYVYSLQSHQVLVQFQKHKHFQIFRRVCFCGQL